MSKMAKKYGDCSFCGGAVVSRRVDVVRKWKGKLVVVENVPAGVCQQCGERYYDGKVAEKMDEIMEAASKSKKRISVPVLEYESTKAS